jgi:hypothetical protein
MPGRRLFLPPNIDAEADNNPDPSSPPGPVRPTHRSNQSKPVHPASQDEYSSSAVEDGQDDNDNSDGDDDFDEHGVYLGNLNKFDRLNAKMRQGFASLRASSPVERDTSPEPVGVNL